MARGRESKERKMCDARGDNGRDRGWILMILLKLLLTWWLLKNN